MSRKASDKRSLDKRKQQLGMSIGTASNKLVKALLFKMAAQAGYGNCFHCAKPLTRETFSIEHKIPWLNSQNPVELFFDLNNIEFSHLKCNISAARKNSRPAERHLHMDAGADANLALRLARKIKRAGGRQRKDALNICARGRKWLERYTPPASEADTLRSKVMSPYATKLKLLHKRAEIDLQSAKKRSTETWMAYLEQMRAEYLCANCEKPLAECKCVLMAQAVGVEPT